MLLTSRPFSSAIAALALAALLAGCSTIGLGPRGGGALVGDAAEQQAALVGAEDHARIVATYGGIYRNPELEKTLATIVDKLVANSEDPKHAYRITILNAPAINAFALPGGNLYVTRGLLALASDSAEVGAVLAHEMAHVIANHAAQRAEKERTAMIVSRTVTDALDNGDAGQLALASSQRTLAGFSRQQELEADQMGVKNIAKAGYDPYAAARFLSVMSRYAAYRSSQAGGAGQDRRADFLATHPSTPERVDFANKAAQQFGPQGTGEVDRARYLDSLSGMVFGDDTAQGYVRGRSFIHAGLGVSFTVPEGFVLDNTLDAVLATGADGTALRFDGVTVAADTSLEDYLGSGWINGLERETIRNFTLNGLEAVSALARAKGWIFRITVVRAASGSTYRFIFANESDTQVFRQASDATVNTFGRMSAEQAAALKPLRIRIETVRNGDTDESMARRMRGVDRPLDLFRVLNEIQPGMSLKPGAKVKLVTE